MKKRTVILREVERKQYLNHPSLTWWKWRIKEEEGREREGGECWYHQLPSSYWLFYLLSSAVAIPQLLSFGCCSHAKCSFEPSYSTPPTPFPHTLACNPTPLISLLHLHMLSRSLLAVFLSPTLTLLLFACCSHANCSFEPTYSMPSTLTLLLFTCCCTAFHPPNSCSLPAVLLLTALLNLFTPCPPTPLLVSPLHSLYSISIFCSHANFFEPSYSMPSTPTLLLVTPQDSSFYSNSSLRVQLKWESWRVASFFLFTWLSIQPSSARTKYNVNSFILLLVDFLFTLIERRKRYGWKRQRGWEKTEEGRRREKQGRMKREADGLQRRKEKEKNKEGRKIEIRNWKKERKSPAFQCEIQLLLSLFHSFQWYRL